jgi:hypothetical protein
VKSLFIILCLLLFSAYHVTAQSRQGVKDTVVYGSVTDNFPGGYDAYDKYITQNVNYPPGAKSINLQGCSYVQFVIEKDGSLTYVKTCRGIGSGMDDEAVRLIRQSGKWKPAVVNGNAVRTKCRSAVNFVLSSDDVTDGTPKDPSFLYKTDY